MGTPSRDFHSPAPHGVYPCTVNRGFIHLHVHVVTGSAYSHDDNQGDRYAASEHSRSPSPPAGGFQAINQKPKPTASLVKTLSGEGDATMNPPPIAAMPKKGPGRGNWRRNKERSEPQPILPNTSSFGFVHESPAPTTPASYFAHAGSPSGSVSFQHLSAKDHVPTPSYQSAKRHRPLTSHQQAVNDHRRNRVDSILDRGLRKRLKAAKRKREEEGVVLQAWKRIHMLPSGYDSEDEGRDKAKEDSKDKDKDENGKNRLTHDDKVAAAIRKAAGHAYVLGGFRIPKLDKEMEREKARGVQDVDPEDDDDFGEQARYLADIVRRYNKRLDVWDRPDNSGVPFSEAPEQTLPYVARWEKEYLEAEQEFVAAQESRPRQARRRGGAGGASGARKSKGGPSTSTTDAAVGESKQDTQMETTQPDEGDEHMVNGLEAIPSGGNAGELDDDDREILGEVEGDDSDDEEEEEEDDGEGMDEE